MGWSVLHDDYDEVVHYTYTKRAYQEKVDEIWRWFNSTDFMCIGSWFLRQGLFEASCHGLLPAATGRCGWEDGTSLGASIWKVLPPHRGAVCDTTSDDEWWRGDDSRKSLSQRTSARFYFHWKWAILMTRTLHLQQLDAGTQKAKICFFQKDSRDGLQLRVLRILNEFWGLPWRKGCWANMDFIFQFKNWEENKQHGMRSI